MKRILPLLSIILISGCNALGTGSADSSDFVNDAFAPTVPVTQSTHGGWTQIKAVGPKTPAAQAADLSSVVASVTLSWSSATAASGTIASYSLYRSASSGGTGTLVASGITTVARTYTDSTVSANQTYYYKAVPVLTSGEVTEVTGTDAEIKIMVPPANMVLLHRWAANLEACTEMGKTSDRDQNYRCAVSTGANAPPGTGGSGYIDLGGSVFVDMFEQGCNYTYDSLANKCGSADGCIGIIASPGGVVTGNNGDIYYNRRSGSCFINTSAGSGTSWTTATSTTAGNRALMGSAAAGLPPFVNIDQIEAQSVCTGQTVAGISGTKRLLRRQEQVLVAAWDSALADATINTMENGINLNTTGHCNSNYASPQGDNATDISGTHPTIAYDNLVVPAAKDTLPGCLLGDCSTGGVRIRSVRTGSNATSSCVSKFGAQDMAGNVWELASDQISCNGATCTGVSGVGNTADSTNDDFTGVAFDGTQGPAATGVFSTWGKIQFPVGIPIAGGAFAGDGTVTRTAAQFHTDHFRINVGAATRAGRSGGSWYDGSNAGRFQLNFNYSTTGTDPDIGFRCAITAD